MALKGLGIEPVPGDNPAGTDVAYETSFEQLNEEVKKLGSPTSGTLDWRKVQDLATEILRNQSKNFLVACYLNIALFRLEAWRGFAEGVQILQEILPAHWEHGFPPKKRMRGRRNAFLWWKEQVEQLLENSEPVEWPAAERQVLIDNLWAIDSFLAENMEDGPMLRALIGAVGNQILEPAAPEPQETPESEVEEQQQELAQSVVATPPVVASSPPKTTVIPDQELPPEKNFDKGCDFLRLAASQYLAKNPFHPLAYRINRIVAWFPIDSLPPATDGQTMLPPPDSQQQSILKGFYQAGNWQGLLEAAEPLVRQYLFWLDLSYFTYSALEKLGQKVAAAGIKSEILLLVQRLPGIEKLCFSDGSAFAIQATREWIKEPEGGAGNSVQSSAGNGQGLWSELAAAQAQGKEDQAAGLDLFRQGLRTATNHQEQLLWSTELCRFLCRQQQPALAQPYAERLLQQMEQHQLELWDPELAASVLETVLLCLQQLKNEIPADKINTIFQRLALLNPGRAMEMI